MKFLYIPPKLLDVQKYNFDKFIILKLKKFYITGNAPEIQLKIATIFIISLKYTHKLLLKGNT
jgi:hypothetical protein